MSTRKLIIPLFFIALLLLAGCSSSESLVRESAQGQQFLKIYPDAHYEEAAFSAKEAMLIKDLSKQECPEIEPPFTRGILSQWGASLVVYTQDDAIICALTKLETGSAEPTQGDLENAPEGVALTVNGEPITLAQIQAGLATVPAEQQTLSTINTIIDQLITNELLRQEAEKIVVSADDVEEAYQSLLEQNGLSEEEFEAKLEEQEISLDDVRAQIKASLQVDRLLSEKLGNVSVDDDELRDFYLQNTNAFVVSEQVTFAQVFVSTANRTPELALERAQRVARALENQEFCAVVRTYSDDTSSVERCGMYTVPRGVVSPEIDQAVFSMAINETSVVQSSTGYHFLWKVGYQPTQVVPYDQAVAQLRDDLVANVRQLRLNAYTAWLREDAEIVSYLTVQNETSSS